MAIEQYPSEAKNGVFDRGAVGFAQNAIFVVFVLFALRKLTVGFHRLFLSPLSKIPGPKLAALTYWYEGYYEVWLGGQYFRKIESMHKKYGSSSRSIGQKENGPSNEATGPIVRINPNEVHFNDPEFIDGVLAGPSRKTNRHPNVAKRTGTPDSIVATVDHDIHRQRRNALNSFFSTASIRRLEPIIRNYMEKLLDRMARLAKEGSAPVQMHHVFKACTSDVINTYAFADSFGFMDREDFGKPYFAATDLFFSLNHVMGFFPLFAFAVQNSPAWAVKAMMPQLTELVDKKTWWVEKVREIRNSPNPEHVKSTIFEGILDSSLPPIEKTDIRLASEAQLVIFAGEGTTAFTLTAAMYQLLANPAELIKLKAELEVAIPDAEAIPTFAQVDGLPYFQAIVQEVIRLHPGVMNRQMRVPAEEPIVYKDAGREYIIPAGTVTSMSPLCLHMDPNIFENPYKFRPQRWIDDPKLARSFLGFSRGTRGCVGMNLARREMAIILATIFRKYDIYHGQSGKTLELYNTERARDIDANSDLIIPAPAAGSQGLRIRIRN